MKTILRLVFFLLLSGALVYVSCKKEYSCENCRGGNKFPVAIAGNDTIIVLPADSIIIDGNASFDPDGSVTSYQWTKISGPASIIVNNASSARTVVKNLTAGSYRMELKITDNGGLSAKDTMTITVDPAITNNHPPVANAGADQTITLPTNNVNLDGNASFDPDNNITSYAWTKISGPSSFTITNPNAVQTPVTNLIQGVYQFELKVTDAGGLFSKDTVQITINSTSSGSCPGNRPVVNAQLVPFGTLSQAREAIAVASAGNKIVFAGGRTSYYSATGDATSRVDIYDIASQSWSIAELSAPRMYISTITCGNKIIFAGGYTTFTNSGQYYTNVDIYDAATNTWSVTSLPEIRYLTAIAAVGNKVFFVGGETTDGTAPSDKVDIYDVSTNNWSTAVLSQARFSMAAVTINNKIYFAGGQRNTDENLPPLYSDRIDIYDNSTNSWSVSSLSVPKSLMGSIAVGNKIYWAGGMGDAGSDNSFTGVYKTVEIRDITTQSTSFDCLSQPKLTFDAAEKDNKIVFFTNHTNWGNGFNNWFDLYDITNNSWSIGQMSQEMFRASIISVNNTIYVTGAEYPSVSGPPQFSNQVWKLEF